jgi:hypothetical protein
MPTPFLDLCKDLQISSPQIVVDIVRRSFGSLVHESVLFLALGYDYWFNPEIVRADERRQTECNLELAVLH